MCPSHSVPTLMASHSVPTLMACSGLICNYLFANDSWVPAHGGVLLASVLQIVLRLKLLKLKYLGGAVFHLKLAAALTGIKTHIAPNQDIIAWVHSPLK